MHELGILVQIVRTVEKAALENHAEKIRKISLQVGEISGAVPDYMHKQFPLAILDKPMFEDCELDIEELPAMGECQKCGKVYHLTATKGKCPSCGADDFITMSGTQLFLKEITAY